MRKKITISAAAVAGVATAGLLAMPIASALADDDVAMKRDEDAPALTTVVDDDDPDGTDPTDDRTNGITQTGGATSLPTDAPTNATRGGATRGDATGDQTRDAVTYDATDDASGDASGDD
jgi:hypothetical protein